MGPAGPAPLLRPGGGKLARAARPVEHAFRRLPRAGRLVLGGKRRRLRPNGAAGLSERVLPGMGRYVRDFQLREIDMGQEELRVLVELASSDTRIGAVNDALDLAHFTAPLGVKVVLCGRIDRALRALAQARGIAMLRGKSRVISKLGLPLYALSVL